MCFHAPIHPGTIGVLAFPVELMAALTQDAARQQALARGAALTLVVLGLAVAVFTSMVLYAALRRRRLRAEWERRTPTQPFDAWKAAADRIKYEKRADQYEDDDDDTDESTWYEDDNDDDDDDDSYGSNASGDDPKPPTGGPSNKGPDEEDDSFAGDDIPGSRLDF